MAFPHQIMDNINILINNAEFCGHGQNILFTSRFKCSIANHL